MFARNSQSTTDPVFAETQVGPAAASTSPANTPTDNGPSSLDSDIACRELERLRSLIQPTRQALLNHALYGQLHCLEGLQRFMEFHVFAVWDFMSLLKALQQRLCPASSPWLPSSHPSAARLINAIVLGEETDEDGTGGFASHFELYHRSMRQCGASTVAIDAFLSALCQGRPVAEALCNSSIGEPIRQFVTHTFAFIDSGDLCAIASAFTFGREDLLPSVFTRIIDELNIETHGKLDSFRYYLNRHIQLDADEHGPMAEALLAHLCGSGPSQWKSVQEAALAALKARLDFWDAISSSLK